MTKISELTDSDRWLAAEYALGVLGKDDLRRAEEKFDKNRAFRLAVEGWQNQLNPLLDEVEEVIPSQSVWQKIEQRVDPLPVARGSYVSSGNEGYLKAIAAFMSTAAVGCLGLLMYFTGGDFSGNKINQLQEKLSLTETQLEQSITRVDELEKENETTRTKLTGLLEKEQTGNTAIEGSEIKIANLTRELEETRNELKIKQREIDDVLGEIESSKPLVASLTRGGEVPEFVAQYDPLRRELLIQTSLEDEDERVPELWFIPDQGEQKGEIFSLGVIKESASNAINISDEMHPLFGKGSTLAVSMEPIGGAPEGVATGPVVAIGKLQNF